MNGDVKVVNVFLLTKDVTTKVIVSMVQMSLIAQHHQLQLQHYPSPYHVHLLSFSVFEVSLVVFQSLPFVMEFRIVRMDLMRSIVVAEILSSHAAMVVNVLMHGENVMARLTVQIDLMRTLPPVSHADLESSVV